MKTDRKFFSIYDLLIIILIVCISVLFIIIQFNRGSGLTCVIRHNGEVIDSYVLSDISSRKIVDYDFEEKVEICIEKDGVSVISSTCRDKICEKSGKITRGGQTIVCLPGKLSISLESGKSDSDVDTVIG